MHAVVLAAGLGSRLASGHPKPLTPVGGIPLIDRTIAGLLAAGAESVLVVVGHEGPRVAAHIAQAFAGRPVRTIDNPRFREANGLSVLCARGMVPAPFVLCMADHLVDAAVWATAFAHRPDPQGATLLIDRDVGGVFDLDDATKVRSDGRTLLAIGKALEDYDAIDVGVFVVGEGLLDALAEEAEARGDASLSAGVQRLATQGRMSILDIGAAFWQDVDTPEMLVHAEGVLARMP